MKKWLYFLPVVLALCLYGFLGQLGLGPFSPWMWFWLAVLVVSSAALFWNKWYGCVGGLILGGVLIGMGVRYTGQTINEMVLGIPLFLFYLGSGILVYRKST